MAVLPDPARSRAVLIGASTYRHLEDLPAVRNNLSGFRDVLIAPALGGLPADNCTVVAQPANPVDVYRTLRQQAAAAEDTLLVYFAGHGRTGSRNELWLCLPDTDPGELPYSAWLYDELRRVVADSRAAKKVVILDCCFSGRALADQAGDEEAVLGQVGIEGTYILTATAANEVALAPPGERYTAFTGALLDLLNKGIRGGSELLTFAQIYPRLQYALTSRQLPRPRQQGSDTIADLALTRNVAYTGRAGTGVKIIPADHSIVVGATVFRYIPPGTAWIGSDNGYEHERPRHQVKQQAFFLQDAPVTNAEFDMFCNDAGYRTSAELGSDALYVRDGVWQPLGGATWRLPSDGISPHPKGNDHPVVQVSWHDAGEYCRWFAGVTGLPVGLPTETQWEYAAGGPAGLRWPFGDTYKPGMANLENSGTAPVRKFPPNAFGLYDMAGNTYEWCADWYVAEWARAGHALSGAPSPDPTGPGGGSYKILRGGSWLDIPFHCRTANRFYAAPILAAANWGFRPCMRLNGDLVRTLISEPGWDLRAEDMLEGN
jgi:formylglycine-generating enzyme required for sulfatase activity